ncbi:MAG: DUF3368 domain-containing protein [Bacteroidetes bacterium]|nr:DUF3368 domain-containing protein [Bacteroidota bacterium]
MPRVIISDTSCLIVLSNIGELELLHKVYGNIVTTKEVADEFGLAFPSWIQIQSPTDSIRQTILELQVDKGEASAISLALEISDCTIILDDNKARRLAQQLGLHITGTIGVIVKAKRDGIIQSIKPFLSKIKTTDFRLTEELEALALRLANEAP